MKKVAGIHACVASLILLCASSSFGGIIGILSDNSWKSYDSEQPGWTTIGYDDSGWRNAYAPYPFAPGFPPDLKIPGTLAVYMWDWPYVDPPMGWDGPIEAWFRMTFTLPWNVSDVASALLTIGADDYFDLYVNTNLVAAGVFGVDPPLPTYDIKPYLQSGSNVIAIHAWDGLSGSPQDFGYEWALVDATITPVPEPACVLLVGTGLGALALAAHRRRKQ